MVSSVEELETSSGNIDYHLKQINWTWVAGEGLKSLFLKKSRQEDLEFKGCPSY